MYVFIKNNVGIDVRSDCQNLFGYKMLCNKYK